MRMQYLKYNVASITIQIIEHYEVAHDIFILIGMHLPIYHYSLTLCQSESRNKLAGVLIEWVTFIPPLQLVLAIWRDTLYHMMRAHPPRKLQWRNVSRPPPPGLLQAICYERQHVYLLRPADVNHAIFFFVKQNTSTIHYDMNRRLPAVTGTVGGTPSHTF